MKEIRQSNKDNLLSVEMPSFDFNEKGCKEFFDKCANSWKDLFLEPYEKLFSSSKPKKRLAQGSSKADKRAKRHKKPEDGEDKIEDLVPAQSQSAAGIIE